jgi:hypothetical protein
MNLDDHRGAIQKKTGPRGGKWWRRGSGPWQSGEWIEITNNVIEDNDEILIQKK